METTTGCDKRTNDILIGTYQTYGYLAHWATFFQCLCSDSVIRQFPTVATFFCTMTTISSPDKSFWLYRKLSLIRRFILFRVTASRTRFFEIARPRRAVGSLFGLAKTMNCLSTERNGESNIFLNSAAFFSLLTDENPCVRWTTVLGG